MTPKYYYYHISIRTCMDKMELLRLRLNAPVSTKTIYMTTTNNEGLIPSLIFLSCYKFRRRKNILFFNAVETRLSFLKPTFIHIFDYLVFRFILEKQRNNQCCPITIFCANRLLVPCYLSSLQKLNSTICKCAKPQHVLCGCFAPLVLRPLSL